MTEILNFVEQLYCWDLFLCVHCALLQHPNCWKLCYCLIQMGRLLINRVIPGSAIYDWFPGHAVKGLICALLASFNFYRMDFSGNWKGSAVQCWGIVEPFCTKYDISFIREILVAVADGTKLKYKFNFLCYLAIDLCLCIQNVCIIFFILLCVSLRSGIS